MKLTWVVKGSLSHCQAPMAVQIVETTKIILHLIVPGRRHVITSVNLRSNAFKSKIQNRIKNMRPQAPETIVRL